MGKPKSKRQKLRRVAAERRKREAQAAACAQADRQRKVIKVELLASSYLRSGTGVFDFDQLGGSRHRRNEQRDRKEGRLRY